MPSEISINKPQYKHSHQNQVLHSLQVVNSCLFC